MRLNSLPRPSFSERPWLSESLCSLRGSFLCESFLGDGLGGGSSLRQTFLCETLFSARLSSVGDPSACSGSLPWLLWGCSGAALGLQWNTMKPKPRWNWNGIAVRKNVRAKPHANKLKTKQMVRRNDCARRLVACSNDASPPPTRRRNICRKCIGNATCLWQRQPCSSLQMSRMSRKHAARNARFVNSRIRWRSCFISVEQNGPKKIDVASVRTNAHKHVITCRAMYKPTVAFTFKRK